MVWLPFFAIVGARSLARPFSRIFFFSSTFVVFLVFRPVFLLLLRRFDPLLLIFLPLCFFLFLAFSSFLFRVFFVFSYLPSYGLMLKRKKREKTNRPDTCVFLYGICIMCWVAQSSRLFSCVVYAVFLCTALCHCYIAVVTIAWANIHHQPSKLCRSFSVVAFCFPFFGSIDGAEAAVDSSIARFFSLYLVPARLLNFFWYMCFFA